MARKIVPQEHCLFCDSFPCVCGKPATPAPSPRATPPPPAPSAVTAAAPAPVLPAPPSAPLTAPEPEPAPEPAPTVPEPQPEPQRTIVTAATAAPMGGPLPFLPVAPRDVDELVNRLTEAFPGAEVINP